MSDPIVFGFPRSTFGGVQDVAAAWAAYREASRACLGLRFDLTG